MFYDHRILTQRKYGVATVWLVATIGPKSSISKTVHKKEILDVDLRKACHTIMQSESPLALRLQSNLLFGVSRVFFEQYSYLFTDVINAHQKISRDFLMRLDTKKIDLVSNRVKSDTILLRDDPTFIPELAFILPELNVLPEDRLHHTTQLSFEDKTLLPVDHGGLGSQILGGSISPFGGLAVPDSSSLDGIIMPFQPPCHDSFEMNIGDQEKFEEEIDFVFDENGEIQDIPIQHPQAHGRNTVEILEQPLGDFSHTNILQRNRWDSLSVMSDQVRREHEEGAKNMNADNILMNLEDFQDEYGEFQNLADQEHVEPFPRPNYSEGREPMPMAPLKYGKTARLVYFDENMELPTSEFAALGSNYIENMEQAKLRRSHLQNVRIAKKAAIEYIFCWNGILRTHVLQSSLNGNQILRILNVRITDNDSQQKGSAKNMKRERHEIEGEETESEGSQYGRRIRGEFQTEHEPTEFLEDINMQNLAYDDQVT
ncbi:hypothetical protein TWF694_010689 [Orbilia ellipsospora]|uniref:Rad21/Rec8-like protein N-terminal domain-containing protein n=1 Tax=Orbilia ellipsospora TaxID=2528407 RepID=A0AAV9X735_9PEZI